MTRKDFRNILLQYADLPIIGYGSQLTQSESKKMQVLGWGMIIAGGLGGLSEEFIRTYKTARQGGHSKTNSVLRASTLTSLRGLRNLAGYYLSQKTIYDKQVHQSQVFLKSTIMIVSDLARASARQVLYKTATIKKYLDNKNNNQST